MSVETDQTIYKRCNLKDNSTRPSVEQTVRDPKLQNWLKGNFAMVITKEGLENFVEDDIETFRKNVLQSIYTKHSIAGGTICTSCTTENVLHCPTKNFCAKKLRCNAHNLDIQEKKPGISCPHNICNHIKDAIHDEHRYNGPSWKNTNAKAWCIEPFELAKCYLPPEGYATVTSLGHADFNATLSVILNKKSFENKMLDTLNQKKSLCSQAREICREIRHSATLHISDENVENYITVFIDLLSDAKHLAADQSAKEAVTKLEQLRANTLTVTTTEIIAFLDDANKDINTNQQDVQTKAEKENIDTIKSELANMQTVSFSHLNAIIAAKKKALEEIRTEKERALKEIENQQKAEPSEAWPSLPRWLKVRRLRKRLLEDLITYYRRCHSTIPVSPLIKEHDASLVEFYVAPTLESVEISGYGAAKRKFCSYKDLFMCEKEPYKEIYVTAKAGIGKTSFSKKVCMTWCQAHCPVKAQEALFESKDTSTLKQFDYVFMIALKEAEKDICDIDDMVHLLVQPWSRDYTKAFIEETIREKRVLIILDGLDEWTHPLNCKRKMEVIPHRRPCSKCTVMTTTRSWKLAAARLSNSQIDMQAELLQFNEASSKELVLSAVKLLNRTFGKSKSADDFQQVVQSINLGALKLIPYILLQILCLWFDDKTIGKSQCEIYSNTLELTLLRRSSDIAPVAPEPVQNDTPPACITQNTNCLSHYPILLKLGQLAFGRLTSCRNESTLIFDDDIVNKYLTEEDLNIVLNVGLLSQNKDYEKVSSRRSKFSFQHKSIQEYFAALYIQSHKNNPEILGRILQRQSELESFLEMTNILVFLGGFSPDACEKIFKHLRHKLTSDETVCHYRSYLSGRTSLPEARKCWEVMKSFQCLEVDILKEIMRNGHTELPELPLFDVVLDNPLNQKMFSPLELIVRKNKESILSLSIEQYGSSNELREELRRLGLLDLKDLEKLEIAAPSRESDLSCLLNNSKDTLVCLDICIAYFKNNTSTYRSKHIQLLPKTIEIVSHMDHLQSVRLNGILLRDTDVQTLLTFLGERITMTEIGLCQITCMHHKDNDCGTLDLSQHTHLKTLRIGSFPVSNLSVNPSSLNFCYTGMLVTAVHSSLVRCLQAATHLGTLRLKYLGKEQLDLYSSDTLAQLHELRSFAIEYTDFGERDLTLPLEMTTIERVHFYEDTMTSSALERFIQSIDALPQAVLVIIEGCIVTPERKYRKIQNMVRSSRKYRVRFDTEKRFSFETRKTEDISLGNKSKESSIPKFTILIASAIIGVFAMVLMFYYSFYD